MRFARKGELRDGGNTVIVVEHEPELMAQADWVVDLGQGAGSLGGSLVVAGTPAEVAAHPTSLTGKALRGEIKIERAPRAEGMESRASIRLVGARTRNLRGVDLEVRFGELLGVCGPSGS